MAITVYTHNVLRGFGEEDTAMELVDRVADIAPTVAVFPEAFHEGQNPPFARIREALGRIGYDMQTALYNDLGNRPDRNGMLMATRLDAATPQPYRGTGVLRLATRNALCDVVIDKATNMLVRVVGLHLDDRSSDLRLRQSYALCRLLDMSYMPVLIAGDINNPNRQDVDIRYRALARVATMAAATGLPWLQPSTPQVHPTPHDLKWWLSRLTRLDEMLDGEALAILTDAGYASADPEHRPTYPTNHPFLQLDHVLHSQELKARGGVVLPADNISDHRGIVAMFSLKQA